MSDSSYSMTRIRFPGRSWRAAWEPAAPGAIADLADRGIGVWGVFAGLFGLASNELVFITYASTGDADPGDELATGSVIDRVVLSPTARPHGPIEPLDRDGLYVLRSFDVEPANHAEFVEVSTAAWETFETTDAFGAEAMGLFTAAADASTPPERMLLVTWYDGFGSWTASRTPDPAAKDAFARRQRLTQGTIASATTLVRHG